jgi:hypothetical protein
LGGLRETLKQLGKAGSQFWPHLGPTALGQTHIFGWVFSCAEMTPSQLSLAVSGTIHNDGK